MKESRRLDVREVWGDENNVKKREKERKNYVLCVLCTNVIYKI